MPGSAVQIWLPQRTTSMRSVTTATRGSCEIRGLPVRSRAAMPAGSAPACVVAWSTVRFQRRSHFSGLLLDGSASTGRLLTKQPTAAKSAAVRRMVTGTVTANLGPVMNPVRAATAAPPRTAVTGSESRWAASAAGSAGTVKLCCPAGASLSAVASCPSGWATSSLASSSADCRAWLRASSATEAAAHAA